MKKIIALFQSFTGKNFDMLCEHIESLTSEDCFCIFHGFDSVCEISEIKANYEALKKLLQSKNIRTEILEEYSLDEYFYNHKEGDIYITPTDSAPVVISSAALLEFEGNVYLFGSSKNEPQLSNITPQIRAFKYKDSIGKKGLNRTEVHYEHAKGNSCFYYIGRKRYSQILKGKRNVSASGVQGYTMVCECYPNYRIKIWDSFAPKYQYELDEVALMIANKLSHSSIALPISFVYNEKNEPIGFLMKNFQGEELDIRKLSKLKNPLKIVEQMLTAILWMETHDLYHRDVNHNMLIDADENLAVIDVDSIQYKAFPSTASANDPLNALPKKYFSNSLFYNTIDISYTTMAFVVASFFDIEDFFGVWDESGLCSLNQKLFSQLWHECPSVARLVEMAYVEGRPVAVERQLEIIRNAINGNIDVKEDPYSDSYDEFNGDYPDINESPDSSDFSDALDEDDYDDNTDDFNESKKPHGSINSIDGIEPNKRLYNLVWFFRKLIMSMFFTGTVVRGMTPEKEWQEFMRSRKWVKPLIASVLAVILMIVMLIAIIIM